MLLEKMKKWYTKVLLEKNDKKWLKNDTQKCCWEKMINKNDKNMIHKNAAGKKSIKHW